MNHNQHYLETLFAPRSVVVAGASPRAGSLGGAVFTNLRTGRFHGPLHALNPRYAEIDGIPCHATMAAVPGPVDLAVIATPAPTVPTLLAEAAAAGIRNALVLSAGFGEAGEAGRALQRELQGAARSHGIRLIGPNCLGMMRPAIGLNATFARTGAHAGGIALVSQSGAVCAALADWAWAAGIGFSSLISLGAAADLDFGEILDYLLHDSTTTSILLYVEGVRDARRFIGALRAASRTKPIVVLKVGRDRAASRAALSHTGALAGDDAVFAAVLRRCGVVRADTYMDLFAAARLLGAGRLPTGNRLAVLTNGGGPGVMAVDCAGRKGVEIATLAPATLATLDTHLPAHWSHGNPVDIIGDATTQRYVAALEALLADPGVDGVLTLFCPQIITTAAAAAEAMLPLVRAATKPVLTAWLGEADAHHGRDAIEAAGMPAFESPESAVTGFAALAEYRRAQQLLLEAPPPRVAAQAADTAAAHGLARAVTSDGRTLMTEPESKRLLAAFGIPVPRTVIAATLVEAIAAGNQLGYPLAIKILSPDIAHKSDVQGVVLSIRDLPELEREFRNLLARVAHARPQARLDGVAIQPMVEKRFGRELLIGVARDPVFGQVISFGAGGVAVELLRDNAIGLPPLNARLAEDLIGRTRIARLLGAYRHIPAAHRAAIIDTLLKVSDMVCALPWLAEMDINPLTVDESGAVALDARVLIDPARLAEDPRYAHLAIHPYPERLAQPARLRDGETILVRPVRPEDAAMELGFFAAMSDESRYFRFFNATRNVSPSLLARLTQIDYDRDMALVAVTQGTGGEKMLGVARYAQNPDRDSCEFAVTVADICKRRGLARLLMHRLIDTASAAGYTRMAGSVLAGNAPMRALMQSMGFTGGPDADDPSVIAYEYALTPGSTQAA